MLEDFNWKCQERKNKGKAMGGIITGVKKDIKEEYKNGVEKKTERIQARKIIMRKDKWNIAIMYRVGHFNLFTLITQKKAFF